MARDLYRNSYPRFETLDLDYQIPIWKEDSNRDGTLKRITLRDFFALDIIQSSINPPNWGSNSLTVTGDHIHDLAGYNITLNNGTHTFNASVDFRVLGQQFMPNVTQDDTLTKLAVFDNATGEIKWRDAASIVPTANNGLTIVGTNVELGGDLTKVTTIGGAGLYALNLGENLTANRLTDLNVYASNATIRSYVAYPGSTGSTIAATTSGITLSNNLIRTTNFVVDPAGVVSTLTSGTISASSRVAFDEASLAYSDNSLGGSLSISNTALVFTDTTAALNGVVYAGDYSATFINESLITKRYVDTAIAAIPTPTNMYTANDTIGTSRVATLTDTFTIRRTGGTTVNDDVLRLGNIFTGAASDGIIRMQNSTAGDDVFVVYSNTATNGGGRHLAIGTNSENYPFIGGNTNMMISADDNGGSNTMNLLLQASARRAIFRASGRDFAGFDENGDSFVLPQAGSGFAIAGITGLTATAKLHVKGDAGVGAENIANFWNSAGSQAYEILDSREQVSYINSAAPTDGDLWNNSYVMFMNAGTPSIRYRDNGGLYSTIVLGDTNFANTDLTLSGARLHQLDSNNLTMYTRTSGTTDRWVWSYNNVVGGPKLDIYDRFTTKYFSTGENSFGTATQGVTFTSKGLDVGVKRAIEMRQVGGNASYILFSDQFNSKFTQIGANTPHYFLNQTGALSIHKFIVGNDVVLGTEDISLQGTVLISSGFTQYLNTLQPADADLINNSGQIWVNSGTPTLRYRDNGGSYSNIALGGGTDTNIYKFGKSGAVAGNSMIEPMDSGFTSTMAATIPASGTLTEVWFRMGSSTASASENFSVQVRRVNVAFGTTGSANEHGLATGSVIHTETLASGGSLSNLRYRGSSSTGLSIAVSAGDELTIAINNFAFWSVTDLIVYLKIES